MFYEIGDITPKPEQVRESGASRLGAMLNTRHSFKCTNIVSTMSLSSSEARGIRRILGAVGSEARSSGILTCTCAQVHVSLHFVPLRMTRCGTNTLVAKLTEAECCCALATLAAGVNFVELSSRPTSSLFLQAARRMPVLPLRILGCIIFLMRTVVYHASH